MASRRDHGSVPRTSRGDAGSSFRGPVSGGPIFICPTADESVVVIEDGASRWTAGRALCLARSRTLEGRSFTGWLVATVHTLSAGRGQAPCACGRGTRTGPEAVQEALHPPLWRHCSPKIARDQVVGPIAGPRGTPEGVAHPSIALKWRGNPPGSGLSPWEVADVGPSAHKGSSASAGRSSRDCTGGKICLSGVRDP